MNSMYITVSRYKTYIRVRIMNKVQVDGKWKSYLVEHIGSVQNDTELVVLKEKAKQRIAELLPQLSLLDKLIPSSDDTDRIVMSGSFASGLWQIIGEIYDRIGLSNDLFKYLVLARIALPKSKLATIRYMNDSLRLKTSISAVYRFMDTLDKDSFMTTLLNYAQSRAVAKSGATISVVFYDVTTLYFETDEDDEDNEKLEVNRSTVMPGLRKKGYSKDHRFDLPQIVVGLTVDATGFPLDFQVYEGNTYEGHTLLNGIKTIQLKLKLESKKLTVVADAGMLSQANLEYLECQGYSYIVGARIRSMAANTTKQIIAWNYEKDGTFEMTLPNLTDDNTESNTPEILRRLIVTYSENRAKRSVTNRARLVKKLQAKLNRGQVITKSKYIVLDEVEDKNGNRNGDQNKDKNTNEQLDKKQQKKPKKSQKFSGHIDQDKLKTDAQFDGLKGYITNTELLATEVMDHYSALWNVEKSFRMSKSDLRVRPTFHYKRDRIIAHLTICVCSLAVLREFEKKVRVSSIQKVGLSVALEQLLAIKEYQLKLPNKQHVTVHSELTEVQKILLRI